jgi:hypothetical protein
MNSIWEDALRVPAIVDVDAVDAAYKWERKPCGRRSA